MRVNALDPLLIWRHLLGPPSCLLPRRTTYRPFWNLSLHVPARVRILQVLKVIPRVISHSNLCAKQVRRRPINRWRPTQTFGRRKYYLRNFFFVSALDCSIPGRCRKHLPRRFALMAVANAGRFKYAPHRLSECSRTNDRSSEISHPKLSPSSVKPVKLKVRPAPPWATGDTATYPYATFDMQFEFLPRLMVRIKLGFRAVHQRAGHLRVGGAPYGPTGRNGLGVGG
ncbi:hypothetical protein R3P38DRAFT_2879149 [Favolaschia claudopus]|uniref:Uncharacterized protein n=1 Tax=Favolaschia claudopus TaxID=2862362 RepID=A0AAW0CZ29_9AGAR